MRPADWCQPKGCIGAAPGTTEPMGERGQCLYTLKNTSKSRRSAQNTKKSISNSNNEPNFTLHEISGLGKLNPEKTSDELSHADIFLMPSKFEGFPNALLENMANGVVPIVSRIKGVTDWIVDNEVNGLICNQGNSQQFAECVRRLYYDNNLLESITSVQLSGQSKVVFR